MDTKFILIGILLLVVFLQLRNRENFNEGVLNMKTKDDNCNINTQVLNNVNRYQKQACQEDNNHNYSEASQGRLTCRQFEDKQLYLENDRRSWCKGVEKVPKLESINKVGKFTGFDQLEYKGAEPKPIGDVDMDESNFPFEMNMVNTEFLNTDNKQKENA
jgi:hypothetical protein